MCRSRISIFTSRSGSNEGTFGWLVGWLVGTRGGGGFLGWILAGLLCEKQKCFGLVFG